MRFGRSAHSGVRAAMSFLHLTGSTMNFSFRVPQSPTDSMCTVLAYFAVWFFASLTASACLAGVSALFR